MRILIVALCVVTAGLVIAVIGLYLRGPSVSPEPNRRWAAVPSTPSITRPGEDAGGNEWREPIETLNRRLDQMSSELEILREANERERVADAHAPTEQEFPATPAHTILSLVADERSRAFAAMCGAIRVRAQVWCHANNVSNEKCTAVVAVLLEDEKRASAILRRFAPDGKPPNAGDSVRKDWDKAWRELQGMRHVQLARSLDEAQEEQLICTLRPLLEY